MKRRHLLQAAAPRLRQFGRFMSRALGLSLVVENRPGGGTSGQLAVPIQAEATRWSMRVTTAAISAD